MDAFIDVRGQAEVTESVVEYAADLTITVRSSELEEAVRASEGVRESCVRALLAAGLDSSELREGSGEIWRPWFARKKIRHEVSRKILIACPDAGRLQRALGAIGAGERSSVAVSMRPPRFDASPAARSAALSGAIADARGKAEDLAGAAGVRLGPVIQVEEIDDRVGRSGAFGDEEWRSMFGRGGGAPPGGEPPTNLEAAERTRTIRYRVRFELATGAPRRSSRR